MQKIEDVLSRIDQLLQHSKTTRAGLIPGMASGELYMGALSVATMLYGADSPQVEALKVAKAAVSRYAPDAQDENLAGVLYGMLQSIRDEVQAGLVISLQAEATGEVLADFVLMAKQAIGEGVKEIAAVLACAALEDTLKRYAELNGLDVRDRDMSEVVGALKSQGLIKGTRGKLLDSFVTVRNKAFHAQWDKIDATEVQSVIAWVEEFLIKEFSGVPAS